MKTALEFEDFVATAKRACDANGAGGLIQTNVPFGQYSVYIRVHFSRFDLAPGDYVEISAPDGSQYFRFSGQGPHNNGHFWASTISGESPRRSISARAKS